jgi:hypothetical protein
MNCFILKNLKIFIREKNIVVNFFLNLILFIGHVFFLLVKIDNSMSYVPLHYNIYFGIDYFGNWQKLFLIPLAGIFIFIINVFLSLLIIDKKRDFSFFLMNSATFCQILLFFSSIFLMYNI